MKNPRTPSFARMDLERGRVPCWEEGEGSIRGRGDRVTTSPVAGRANPAGSEEGGGNRHGDCGAFGAGMRERGKFWRSCMGRAMI